VKVRERASFWHSAMLAEAEDGVPRGTRWGIGAGALGPSIATVVVLGFAITQGALAASFNVSDQKFFLNVKELQGTGLGAVLAAENVKDPNSKKDQTGVLHAALAEAQLSGLCIVVHQSMLGVKYSITVGANGSSPSSGNSLFFDITDLKASPATLKGAVLGVSADEIAVNDTSLGGQPGGFGLDLTRGSVSLRDVVASAYQSQVAGSLTLPNLGINVKLGDVKGC
jgi:hypothetical protein